MRNSTDNISLNLKQKSGGLEINFLLEIGKFYGINSLVITVGRCKYTQ